MGETVLAEDTRVARDIRFQIKWIDVSEGVQYATLAAISVLVDDLVIWPVFGEPNTPLEWFADEFLSHLVECWKPLLLRQTYPINVYPLRPALLRAEAAKRWSNMPDKVVENEDSLVTAFEEVHNLTNAF